LSFSGELSLPAGPLRVRVVVVADLSLVGSDLGVGVRWSGFWQLFSGGCGGSARIRRFCVVLVRW
ncbi:hypothetical protein L195_g064416, partial [Trifolium pratense]